MMRRGRPFSGGERNTFFLNLGDGRFADASEAAGFAFADDGRGLATVDWDQDGDLDVVTSNRTAPRIRLLRNDVGTTSRSVSFLLIGNGSTVNRDAVGARIELIHGRRGPRSVRTVRAGEGYLSQSSRRIVIGLGTEEPVESVEVRWPDATVSRLRDIEAGGRYVVRQSERGRPAAVEREAVRRVPTLAAGGLEPLPEPLSARCLFASRLPLPAIARRDGSARLIVLWSRACAMCRVELDTVSRAEAALREAGVTVELVCVEDVEASLDDDSLLLALQTANDALLEDQRALSVPCSFLIDRRGDLAAIHRGPLDVDVLLADVALFDADTETLRRNAAPYPGRWRERPRTLDLHRAADVFLRAGLVVHAEALYARALERSQDPRALYNRATALRALGRVDEAADGLRRALELDPDFVLAHAGLASCLHHAGDDAGAAELLERAVSLDASWAAAWYDLGIVRHLLGRAEGALAAFTRAVEVESGYADAWLWLARLREDAGHLDLALDALRSARAARGERGDLMALARFHERRDRLGAATKLYRTVIASAPAHNEARLELARLLAETGDLASSIAVLDEAAAVDEGDAKVHDALGVVLARSGDLARAARAFARAVELDPLLEAARSNLQRAEKLLAETQRTETR